MKKLVVLALVFSALVVFGAVVTAHSGARDMVAGSVSSWAG